ncbi:UbiA family prenyltransferase, partial [bacterium]|nr:UbiA family prenyltransferase [bacterium]
MAKARDLLALVKFEHTVFALPFAYVGALAAGGGWPGAREGWLILAAMVGARTAAMALNRIVDLPHDRKNPRTKGWGLVTGEVRGAEAWAMVVG